MSKKKKTILFVIAVVAVLAVAIGIGAFVLGAKGPFTGTVVNDKTGEPLANVSVSDGRNVVKTSADGKFTLDGYRKSRFVMVTVPAGYVADKFYMDADKETASYDFKLTPSETTANAEHTFLHISDTEIGKDGVGDWINNLRDLAKETKAAFIFHTGDICYEDGLKRHIQDMNTENMGTSVRYSIGNHDYVEGAYGEELYESLYGPVWYSFDVGNTHYVVTPFQNGSDERSGYNSDDRWRWLENDLANTDPGKTVVMFNHTKAPSDDYVISFDNKDIDLKKHNLKAWLFGHYHYNYVEDVNGILNITTGRPDTGGIDQSASGFRIVKVDKNSDITTEMRYYDIGLITDPVDTLWSTQLKENVLFADTLVENDKVYIATVDDGYPNDSGVYCLDAKSGDILWKVDTENSVKNKLIYNEGQVYAQDALGNTYCINANDGKVQWKTRIDLRDTMAGSNGMVLEKEVLYAGCARSITALNAKTGEIIWNEKRESGEASPAEFIVAGDFLIVSSHWNALVGLDIKTGKQAWENKDEDVRFRSSTPVVLNETELLVADSDAIMIFGIASGDLISKTEFNEENDKRDFSSHAQPLIDGDTAYIATAKSGIMAFDLTNKKVKWEIRVGDAMVFTAPYVGKGNATVESSPLKVGNTIMFAASDGIVYTVSEDGQIVKKQNAGAPVFGRIALYDNTVLVSDFSGRVTRFK